MTFRTLSLTLGLAASGYAQTTPTSAPVASAEVVDLDTLVVSASADPKAAFDLAQGVSVLSQQRLWAQAQSSLGETLASLPGVSSTYYGPGASRPLIRGLGGDRVRMLDNGIGTLDASNLSPDHAVSVEPLLVERIEVLRGPSTLLYGSSAVGGVVNVIDNRIPSTAATGPANGRVEGRFDTAAHERTGIFTFTAGGPSVVVQVNGLSTTADDIAIPGVAQTGPDAPADQVEGELPSSGRTVRNGSVGATWLGSLGSVGAAISRLDADYGVPTGDDPAISIRLRQDRLDLRGQIAKPVGPFRAINARLGFADYTHSEISGGSVVNTTFYNRAYEGRVEMLQEKKGALGGTLGAQVARSDFSAVGEEVVTPATLTKSLALFAVEEVTLSKAMKLELGGRWETQSITLGEVDPELPDVPGYAATTGEKRREHSFSVSSGLVVYPMENYSVGLALAYSERLPVAQELFSNGPHGGTGAYEVGTSSLEKERSLGLDLTLRKRAGFLTGSVGVFVNRFRDFIFEEEFDGALLPAEIIEEGLTPYQFRATDALFYGFESEITAHLRDTERDSLHLVATADYVRAEQTEDNLPLPRITPARLGARLVYLRGPWTAELGSRSTLRQNRFAAFETATAGHTLYDALVGYRFDLSGTAWEIFVRGSNLGDHRARVNTSFLKDVAPLPGRNFTLGVRTSF